MFAIPYVSCVMCHVSHVTCPMSNKKSGGASRLRVSYQRGLARLLYKYILYPNWFNYILRACGDTGDLQLVFMFGEFPN